MIRMRRTTSTSFSSCSRSPFCPSALFQEVKIRVEKRMMKRTERRRSSLGFPILCLFNLLFFFSFFFHESFFLLSSSASSSPFQVRQEEALVDGKKDKQREKDKIETGLSVLDVYDPRRENVFETSPQKKLNRFGLYLDEEEEEQTIPEIYQTGQESPFPSSLTRGGDVSQDEKIGRRKKEKEGGEDMGRRWISRKTEGDAFSSSSPVPPVIALLEPDLIESFLSARDLDDKPQGEKEEEERRSIGARQDEREMMDEEIDFEKLMNQAKIDFFKNLSPSLQRQWIHWQKTYGAGSSLSSSSSPFSTLQILDHPRSSSKSEHSRLITHQKRDPKDLQLSSLKHKARSSSSSTPSSTPSSSSPTPASPTPALSSPSSSPSPSSSSSLFASSPPFLSSPPPSLSSSFSPSLSSSSSSFSALPATSLPSLSDSSQAVSHQTREDKSLLENEEVENPENKEQELTEKRLRKKQKKKDLTRTVTPPSIPPTPVDHNKPTKNSRSADTLGEATGSSHLHKEKAKKEAKEKKESDKEKRDFSPVTNLSLLSHSSQQGDRDQDDKKEKAHEKKEKDHEKKKENDHDKGGGGREEKKRFHVELGQFLSKRSRSSKSQATDLPKSSTQSNSE